MEDRCSQQHSDFPLAYIPNSLTLPPPPPPPTQKKKKKKKKKKKERKERKFKDGYLGFDIRYWISCVLLRIENQDFEI